MSSESFRIDKILELFSFISSIVAQLQANDDFSPKKIFRVLSRDMAISLRKKNGAALRFLPHYELSNKQNICD